MSDAQSVVDVEKPHYPVSLSITYPKKLNRWTTLFRWILAIPIYMWAELFVFHVNPAKLGHYSKTKQSLHTLKEAAQQAVVNAKEHVSTQATQVHMGYHHHLPSYVYVASAYIVLPVLIMILFRKKYPKWIFDFNIALVSFFQRVLVYLYCMTDKYPDTDQAQSVHIKVDYPKVGQLHRLLPFVKWLLAIPHYLCLFVLIPCAMVAAILSWVAILFTGRYPRIFFDFIVGVMQWALRVACYTLLLTTDKYPPFTFE